jgi:ribosome-associated toxin RatA of RatAB toxin-antitoxin module
MKRITRSALVEHAAEEVYALVDDIETYPAFLPWCLGARVHERTADASRATLSVGFKGLRQSFTTRNANRPGRAIEMRLEEGPFRHFEAAWRFDPLGPAAARIEFFLEYEISSPLLARVLEPLFDRIADTMVDAFSRRADRVYGVAKS